MNVAVCVECVCLPVFSRFTLLSLLILFLLLQ